jgi:hypothetical protein
MRTWGGLALAGTMFFCILALGAHFQTQRKPEPIKSLPMPKGYVCYRTTGPIIIDGKLDDASWVRATWTDYFVDIDGSAKPTPRLRTRAKMLWDDEYFYVGAELEEPHVWGTLTAHDSIIFLDPDFEVFIDPNGDNHEYYEFEINALNTGWDLFLTRPYRDGGAAINAWEIPGLKTAVHVDGTINNPKDRDRGWSVEIAFPWKVLKEAAHRPSPPEHGDQWRVNFSRVEWQIDTRDGKYSKVPGTKEDNWVWSPQGVTDMHRPETWGYVQFSKEPPDKSVFHPDPTWPVRSLLHRVYYAQVEYQKIHEKWAPSLEALGLANLDGVTLTVGEGTFEASARLRGADQKMQRWHIREDSRIWAD